MPLDFSKFDMDKIWFRYRRPVGWVDGVRQGDNVGIVDTTKDVDLSTWERGESLTYIPTIEFLIHLYFQKENTLTFMQRLIMS